MVENRNEFFSLELFKIRCQSVRQKKIQSFEKGSIFKFDMASGFLDNGKPLASGENKIVDLIKKDKVIEYSGQFIKIWIISRLNLGCKVAFGSLS